MEPSTSHTRYRSTALLWAVVVFAMSAAQTQCLHAQAMQDGQEDVILTPAQHPSSTQRPSGPQSFRSPRFPQSPQRLPDAQSLSGQGMPGIIGIPSASSLPVGTAAIGLNSWANSGVFSRRGDISQWNFQFAIGLSSRIVIGGRGTEVRTADGERRLARDLAANAHVVVIKEGRLIPAAAIGVHDVGGAAVHLRGRYLVATKTLAPWARLTAGYGIGPDILDGLFGGVVLSPSRYVHLLADHDADQFSAGVRLFPIPPRWTAAGIPGVAADLLWNEEGGVSWGLTLSTAIDPVRRITDHRRITEPDAGRTSNGAVTTTEFGCIRKINTELVDVGLENVRVDCTESCEHAVVTFENRRYNRDDFDALRRVFGILARMLPEETETTGVILLNRGLRVMEVTVQADDLLALARQTLSKEALVALTQGFESSPSEDAGTVASTNVAHRSRGKLDVVVAPGIETVLYSEIGLAMARLYVLPEAYVHVLPGTVLSVGATLPLTESPDFPGFMPIPHVHRALAHVALPLPVAFRGMRGITQFSAGRFTQWFYGWLNDTVVTAWGGRVLVGAKAGVQRFRLSKTDRLFAVGRVRFYLPQADARLTLKAGQFFDRDRGYVVDVSRFFGDTEIGLFLRHTDAGALAGIRIALPLSPIKDMKPYPARIRPPSVWHYEQRSLIFEDHNRLITDIAREVHSGHAVHDVYYNRDRMSEAYFFEYFSP